jgi:hypothetical protein
MALEICEWITEFSLVRRNRSYSLAAAWLRMLLGELLLMINSLKIKTNISYHKFACAIYRRATLYVRISTTLIKLIDALMSNRVAIN